MPAADPGGPFRPPRAHTALRLFAVLLGLATAAGGGPAASPLVRNIDILHPNAGRAEWSAQGDQIAFDRPGDRGTYQVYTMKPDGSYEHCLTCDQYELRKTNNFNPTWHPSGREIVFQVQRAARHLGLDPIELATGNRGLYSELWSISLDGRAAYQITRVTENGGALLDPAFSHEGDHLLWSERVQSRIGRWGRWVARIAEYRSKRGVPRLAKPQTFEPGQQKLFLAASAFTPDDRGLLLAGNREPGQPENGMDIYRLDLGTGASERLTHSRSAWDEKARVTVKGDQILWISASEITFDDVGREPPLPLEQLRDLWVMNVDGSDKQRLTHFNDPHAPESLGAAIVDDFSQSPAGDEILAHVIWPRRGGYRESIYRIRLVPSFRREVAP